MKFSDKLTRRILYSHVRAEENGDTLLHYLESHYTRWNAEEWRREIQENHVQLNGSAVPPETRLKQHDCIAYFPGDSVEPEADLHYRICYEDQDLLVVDKPGNLCVHPTGVFFRHTLWNLLSRDYGEIHFVNRLDRETSGLLVAARNARTAAKMEEQREQMRKEYAILVFGRFHGYVHARGVLVPDTESVIEKKRRFEWERNSAENAETVDTEFFEEAELTPGLTLVRAILHTGRQHQIRSTLYSLGYPVVGDKLYGPDERLYLKIRTQTFTMEDLQNLRMPRQALHAAKLSFPHPFSGEKICCESPFDFKAELDKYSANTYRQNQKEEEEKY